MTIAEIRSPKDLKQCKPAELDQIAVEIREKIVNTVSENGGHLASNLGIVEITLALHRVFDCPDDKIIFDVGHQCYAHKIITGRYMQFDTLRTFGGISGFPRYEESECDIYNTGHASTAISAALGLARARDIKGDKNHVIAVVGDGALTGGMCYEALNDAGSTKVRLIVLLNDNEMSISRNVGAISKYLTHMRVSKGWFSVKNIISVSLKHIPKVGNSLYRILQRLKNAVRNVFVHDRLFHALGFRYLGPIDGHNIPDLETVLENAKRFNEPVLIHVVTKKGQGYDLAEEKPERLHGTPPFHVQNGEPRDISTAPSFGAFSGRYLCKMAENNKNIVAITAAMAENTGLVPFRNAFPKRFFDVGIAEEHAVTMAAGLARGGMHPFVVIYDTFLQRAYDQILEDVCYQKLGVCFLIDRAAIGGEDGATHHGVFGISYLRHIPNIVILSPRNCEELKQMMEYALSVDKPVAIRYPKAEIITKPIYPLKAFQVGKWECLEYGKDGVLLAVGGMISLALEVREILNGQGIDIGIYNASSIKPLDNDLLFSLNEKEIPFFTLEEHTINGGFGSAVSELCIQNRIVPPMAMFALPDSFIPHGNRKLLLESVGLDMLQVAGQITRVLQEKHE